jgi:hypothetical protein
MYSLVKASITSNPKYTKHVSKKKEKKKTKHVYKKEREKKTKHVSVSQIL